MELQQEHKVTLERAVLKYSSYKTDKEREKLYRELCGIFPEVITCPVQLEQCKERAELEMEVWLLLQIAQLGVCSVVIENNGSYALCFNLLISHPFQDGFLCGRGIRARIQTTSPNTHSLPKCSKTRRDSIFRLSAVDHRERKTILAHFRAF